MSLESGGLLLSFEELSKLPMHQFAKQDFHRWKNFTSEPLIMVKGAKMKSHTCMSTLLPNRKIRRLEVKPCMVPSANLLSMVQLELSS